MITWQTKLIQILDTEERIYPEIDGFYVLSTNFGCLYSHQLRAIADELDARNEDWQKEIDKYHEHLK